MAEKDKNKKNTEKEMNADLKHMIPDRFKKNPSPEAAPTVEVPKKEKKKESGFWSDVGKSFSGENLGEALAYFTPDIVGGMLGYALGGKRGALEGLQHANKVRLGVDEQRRKDREFNQKQGQILNKAMQQSEWMIETSDGNSIPGVFNPNTGTVMGRDKTGRLVPAERLGELRNMKDVRQTKRQTYKTKEELLKYERKMNYQARLKNEPDVLVQEGLKNIIPKEKAEYLDKQILIGPVAGRFRTMQQWFGAAPEEFTNLQIRSDQVRTAYMNAMSGVAVTKAEEARISSFMPNKNDSWITFKHKIKIMNKVMSERIAVRNKLWNVKGGKKGFGRSQYNYLEKEGKKLDEMISKDGIAQKKYKKEKADFLKQQASIGQD